MGINSGMLPPAKLSTTGKPPQAGRETFSSLALGNLLESLGDERKHHVLDLGPACGSNVAFLADFRYKIYVADLFDSLATKPATAEHQARTGDGLFGPHVVIDEDTRFDVVLAWDVLNYLKRNALLDLFSRLRPFCHRQTLLHALIWGHSEIPEKPMRFSITDERHMTYEVSSPVSRTGPRYAPRELERLMAGFRVTRSYLLRNGMQEYVFRRDAAGSPD